jgi:predicted enzyme related to lactoylglutathione lyase
MSMIIHFEIPADDLERAKKFYSELFRWDIHEVPGRRMYMLITSSGEKAISGALMSRVNPLQKVTNYIDVPSVDEYTAKIEQLGGKIVVRKKAIEGMGFFAICLDTENNTFGIWEENRNAR